MYTNIFGILFILDGICLLLLDILLSLILHGDRRGRGRMVVGFTTCAISAYHH
jgi:hypothetical protein